MHLTAFTDYSLRLLMYLAADPDRRATIGEVARAFDISENHLMKVAHFLGAAGLLATVRGRGGGLELARAPAAINLGAVVRLTDGEAAPAECFDPGSAACVIAPACRLRRALGDAVEAFYAVLDRQSLADLVGNGRPLARLLGLPARPDARP